MFGLFTTKPFVDETLGTFTRRGYCWTGEVHLAGHGPVELRLSGDRRGPDTASLALARELPIRYPSFKREIENALFEHFAPYAEAQAQGAPSDLEAQFPQITRAQEVWSHVNHAHVLIAPMQGTPTVEVAYRVGWDEEHTLAARLQGWRFVELCGSV
jgi:hypothetical protein